MYEVIKYYIWKDNEKFTEEAFDDIDEAIQHARENKCDEVEETAWDSRESYNNYEPADIIRVIWKRDWNWRVILWDMIKK